MHQSEAEQLAECIGCGAEVSPQDRPYTSADDRVLCYACATSRNGVYDEGQDRWVVAPDLGGLLEPTALSN